MAATPGREAFEQTWEGARVVAWARTRPDAGVVGRAGRGQDWGEGAREGVRE